MLTKDHGCGSGIGGLMDYTSHDHPSETDPRPTTAERVAWQTTIGATPTDDVKLAIRMMSGVTADAKILKQQSGMPAGGRKLKSAYHHFSVSFEPGHHPSQAECVPIAEKLLKALGCDDRYAIMTAHTDKDHFHWHVCTARVHPETGLAAPLHHAGALMARIAEEYDKQRGHIVVPTRTARRETREAVAAQVEVEMEHFQPTPDANVHEQQAQACKARKAIRKKEYAKYPQEKVRSHQRPGRPPRSPEHRAQFDDLYNQQRALGTPTAICERQIRDLGRAQKREEALQARIVEQPTPPAPEPKETVPTWAIAPAVLEVQAALDHRDVDASTTTARLVLDQITATGTDTAAEKLAVSALASATGRGKDRPVQALIERDVAVEHRKATHAHLTERYGRAPQRTTLDVEVQRRPIDPEIRERVAKTKLQQVVTYIVKTVTDLCGAIIQRGPSAEQRRSSAPATAARGTDRQPQHPRPSPVRATDSGRADTPKRQSQPRD